MTSRIPTVPSNGETQEDFHRRVAAAYEMLDAQSRQARARRSVWMSGQQAQFQMMWNAAETAQVMGEARDCYVQGSFVAVLVLALAFVEHTLTDVLPMQRTAQGQVKPVMLADAIGMAREQQLFPAALMDRVAALVNHRNPYVLRRPADEPETLRMRDYGRKDPPKTVIEQDAQEAIQVMYEFLRIRLHGTVGTPG